MGQQQLLLLVLGAVIVGLAIMVGINLFGQGAIKANEDAVRQDLLNMAARIEEFYRKPVMLGGGGKDLTLLTSFGQLGYYADDGTLLTTLADYANENGTYTVQGVAAGGCTIQGTMAEGNPANILTCTIAIDTNGKFTITQGSGVST